MSSRRATRSEQERERVEEHAESESVSFTSASDVGNQELVSNIGPGLTCQVGHQVVPVGGQHLDLSWGNEKLSRRNRLRTAKEKAASSAKVDGSVPRYLHTHLEFIYYVCMVPYKRDSGLKNLSGRWSLKLMLSILQKIGFWLMMTFAVLNTTAYIKYNIIYFLASKKPTDFIDFGYWVTVLVIQTVWIILWTGHSERVDYLLNSIEIYERYILGATTEENKGKWKRTHNFVCWVFAFEILSLIAAICKSVLYENWSYWSMENTILDSSSFVAEALLSWQLEQTTYWVAIYGRHLTTTTITLGLFGLVMEFAYRLLMIMIKDTVLMLTITLGACVRVFILRIVDFANLPLEDVRDEDCVSMDSHYETYLRVKDVVMDMNWAFGELVNMLHVGNELFFAYFMKSCLEAEPEVILLLWMLFTVAKVVYGYILAALFHRYNKICESWVHNWSRGKGTIIIQHETQEVGAIIDQIIRQPLAIGEGNFVVDQMFVLKFICLGASLLVYYISETKELEQKAVRLIGGNLTDINGQCNCACI